MKLLILGLVVALVLVLLAIARAGKPKNPIAASDYAARVALFTPAERSFLGVLEQALAGQLRVFGKVRVADVVDVKGTLKTGRQAALNRIQSKHFDFVLCRPDDLSVAAVVELNDATHKAKNRAARDAFLARVCEGVALPLLTVTAREGYSVDALRHQLASLIPHGFRLPAAPREVAAAARKQIDPSPSVSATLGEAPLCPDCSGPTHLQTWKKGPKKGRQFWGCQAFPRCRGFNNIELSEQEISDVARA